MNIAIFTDTFVPQINGVSEVIKGLKAELERTGHAVWIVAPRMRNYRDTDPRTIRIPSVPFPGLTEHRVAFPSLKDVNPRFLKENRIDIIHSQTPAPIGFLGLMLARRLKIPHVHHYQTFFEDYVHYFHLPKKLGRISVRAISRWFCNRCDLVTVPTYPFKSLLESYGVKTEIKLWNSGIDIDRFRKGRSMRQELGISDKAFVLLFVGRLAREKNIPFLLEIMPRLVKKNKDTVLVIAGDGPLRKHLIRYTEELGVADNVVFTRYIPPEKIPDVYKSADVFVFASLTETQGLVTLEAMASGLPVVAVPAYGIKYTLLDGEGCFLVDLNAGDFIAKILLLRDRRARKRMAEKGRKFVRRFSCEKSTRKMIELYKTLKTGRNPGSRG
jgi:glycosyltransferase involved in cell wall biosynthesis